MPQSIPSTLPPSQTQPEPVAPLPPASAPSDPATSPSQATVVAPPATESVLKTDLPAASSINPARQVKLYRILAIAIPVSLLIAAAFLTQSSAKLIKGYQDTLVEINTKNQLLEEAVSFNQFLEAQKINLERLDYAIPSESMVVSVISDIESVIKFQDPQATVKFSSATPAKIAQHLVIPMTISVTAPVSQIPTLLEQLSSLPYILQLVSTESRISGDTTTSSINLRLYVQEPFTGY